MWHVPVLILASGREKILAAKKGIFPQQYTISGKETDLYDWQMAGASIDVLEDQHLEDVSF